MKAPSEDESPNVADATTRKKGKKGRRRKSLQGDEDIGMEEAFRTKGNTSNSEQSGKNGESASSKKKSKREQEMEPAEKNEGLEEDELERNFMKELPENIKKYFRQVGFGKWNKEWLPVLFLSPFDVLDPLRNEWIRKYKTHVSKKVPMQHLVVWYGSKNDSEMRGWPSNVLTFEEAEEKQCHLLPKRIQAKLKACKRLTGPEQDIIDGIEEITVARKLSEAERFTRRTEKNPEKDRIGDRTGSKEEEEEAESEKRPGDAKKQVVFPSTKEKEDAYFRWLCNLWKNNSVNIRLGVRCY